MKYYCYKNSSHITYYKKQYIIIPRYNGKSKYALKMAKVVAGSCSRQYYTGQVLHTFLKKENL